MPTRTSTTLRASGRSSTTTSRAAPPAAAARSPAIDWPLAVVALAAGAAVGFGDGGYFPTDWGWSSLALLWIAAVALFLRSRFCVGGLELAMLACLAGLVGWAALSTVWSTGPERSILEVQRDLVYLGGLATVFLVARGRSIVELLGAVCGAAGLVSAYALLRLFLPDHFRPPQGAFYGLSEPLGYPNALGLVAVVGALLAAAFAVHARAQWRRGVAAAALVVFALTISFTFSHGAWISLTAGLVAMLLLDPRRLDLLRTLAAVVPLAALAVWLGSRADALTTAGAPPSEAAHEGHLLALATLLLAAAAVPATLAAHRISLGRRASIAAAAVALALLLAVPAAALARYGSTAPERAHTTTSLPLSWSGRVPLWRQAWRDWESHPALGSGAGTFEQSWLAHRRSATFVRDAHSLYLETLAELGPLGLALLVATLGLPLLVAVRGRVHPLVPGAAAAYLAYLVHAGGDWDWEMPAVTLLGLFCGAALLLAARRGEPRAPSASGRGVALAATVGLALFAFVGLIGNGALDASARAAAGKRWPSSAAEARKATRWLPWSAQAWWRLAVAQSEEGRLAAARSSLREAIAKSPEEWRPWATLTRLSTGREQRRALRRAARLDPRDPEVVQFLLAPGSLTRRWSYDDAWVGWPVAPVHRQHPIRSSFLDPRVGGLRTGGAPAYHFGVDVAVRDDRPEAGAPPGRTHRVYAIEGGVAVLPQRRTPAWCGARRVAIGHFGYWHVDTLGVLQDGERVRPGQMIGWTCKGLRHVHLAESIDLYGRRVYVNPVHPGMKLEPYTDREPPRIRAIRFFRPAMPRWTASPSVRFPPAGLPLPHTRSGRALLSGRVDVRAWIDDGSLPPDGVSLRVVRERDGRRVLARTVFRAEVFLGDSLGTQAVPIGYHYAPGTRHGVYWFRLFARPTGAYWNTATTAPGRYRLYVKAWDAAGNSSSAVARVTIR